MTKQYSPLKNVPKPPGPRVAPPRLRDTEAVLTDTSTPTARRMDSSPGAGTSPRPAEAAPSIASECHGCSGVPRTRTRTKIQTKQYNTGGQHAGSGGSQRGATEWGDSLVFQMEFHVEEVAAPRAARAAEHIHRVLRERGEGTVLRQELLLKLPGPGRLIEWQPVPKDVGLRAVGRVGNCGMLDLGRGSARILEEGAFIMLWARGVVSYVPRLANQTPFSS